LLAKEIPRLLYLLFETVYLFPQINHGLKYDANSSNTLLQFCVAGFALSKSLLILAQSSRSEQRHKILAERMWMVGANSKQNRPLTLAVHARLDHIHGRFPAGH
jgi:hypothetical protein